MGVSFFDQALQVWATSGSGNPGVHFTVEDADADAIAPVQSGQR